jgi:hypothetical protein
MKRSSLTSRSLFALYLFAGVSACGAGTAPGYPSLADAAVTEASATPTGWVRTATLDLDGPGLDLASGNFVAEGDLRLVTGRTINLTSPRRLDGICPMGESASLTDISTATDRCRTDQNMWVSFHGLFNSAADRSGDSVGAAFLLRDAASRTYRMRVIDSRASYARTFITITYAPIE